MSESCLILPPWFCGSIESLLSPIYIETPHAWYILRMPAKSYVRWYKAFYTPRRVAQIVISHAIKRRQMDFDAFVRGALHYSTSIFGDQLKEDDVWTAVSFVPLPFLFSKSHQ